LSSYQCLLLSNDDRCCIDLGLIELDGLASGVEGSSAIVNGDDLRVSLADSFVGEGHAATSITMMDEVVLGSFAVSVLATVPLTAMVFPVLALIWILYVVEEVVAGESR
jgi:hypothetical protein